MFQLNILNTVLIEINSKALIMSFFALILLNTLLTSIPKTKFISKIRKNR